jgi:hypothetical protein
MRVTSPLGACRAHHFPIVWKNDGAKQALLKVLRRQKATINSNQGSVHINRQVTRENQSHPRNLVRLPHSAKRRPHAIFNTCSQNVGSDLLTGSEHDL